MNKPKLSVILASPRGLCAGVERAIEIVERALKKYGPPVYIRHEIVHNKYVVEDLKLKGAIFVNEIDEIPESAVTIFSAHGVSNAVELNATKRNLNVIDATCPLVKKVHSEVLRHEQENRKVILIGHLNHPEIEGTSGRAKNKIYIVQNIEDIEKLDLNTKEPLAYVTQTTLSIDDTKSIIAALHSKFEDLKGPDINDICYATQNRQNAVKSMLKDIDLLLVIGSYNSSNSNRLRDLGIIHNKPSYLIDSVHDLDLKWLLNAKSIGITAGASAPAVLLENLIMILKKYYDISIKEINNIQENIKFKLPKQLEVI